ncbi:MULTISPECIES: AAA family ATPase [Treponema]|uniref:Flagellar synthesis regulator FleN, putative n=1 Tax=Treponema saccharophilum DSM 2985 TaxID=907348 RepID=H7ENB5_9SPIR|nr:MULTISPECIES: AAA family ATPase [Treponema]EIC00843.1 flagellar synthesis regulator FleN, putative [Treponema saccharophilum DSM 2985]MBQ5538094.1 AAA family ATPase [Treponema sp.]
MQIIPVASGKGGVGKSLLSANLAIALGKAGKKVVLADLDLGASNLHLVIGQMSPKKGIGTFLTGESKFEDIIEKTEYENVSFIAGDSEIPGLSSLKFAQKNSLIKHFQNVDADYLILDLGAGTHLTILDLFLLSPQGIIVTAPTVTATLNGYLFLKNAVFRLMAATFKKGTKANEYLAKLKNDSASLQRLYIPKLIETISGIDPESAEKFKNRIRKFHPRLIMNMIDEPKDADKAQKIRRSCQQYLGLEVESLGIMYRDTMQDKALSSRLPVSVYKPNAVLSQAIFRIAEKIMQSETIAFDLESADDSFDIATEEANDDFASKMSFVEDLVGTGALSVNELAEVVKQQQYEITTLKRENTLLKSKIVKAAALGFKV